LSLKSRLLRASRLARPALADTADHVLRFVRGQAAPEGLFRDRSGKGDLYYTVFGLQCLQALGAPLPQETFEQALPALGGGDGLDFVHLSCLARCWSLGPGAPEDVRRAILARLPAFRTPDGGYDPEPGGPEATAYGCFLALSTYEDLDLDVPDRAALAACLESLRTADGGYTNDRGLPFSSTPATAAVATMLLELGRPVPPEAVDWLRGCATPEGGFLAMPGAPVPDLLSTSTALHAISLAGGRLEEKERRACAAFVLSLLADDGGFRGHSAETEADCEYTFYGLLAIGHLA
jgi:prenyltransferase beta subunit